MTKPFRNLRRMLAACDMDEAYLARRLLRSKRCISLRMMAKYPWTLDECYQIMDLLHIPHDQLSVYFPKDGIDAEENAV